MKRPLSLPKFQVKVFLTSRALALRPSLTMVASRLALLLLISATTVSGHWLHGCYKLKLGCSTPTASISACAYKCRERGAFFGLQTDNQGSRYCWCGSEAPSTGENGEPTDLSTCSDNNDPKWHCSSNSNEWCGRPADNGALSVSRSAPGSLFPLNISQTENPS